jgi:hypothetical protein
MTDRFERQPGSRHRSTRPEVWVCVLVNVDGIESWACPSEDLAFRELAAACRGYWDDARDFERRHDQGVERPPLPLRPPNDDRLVVELYFAVMGRALPPEQFQIAARTTVEDVPGKRL